jgi:phosphatidyl-myo-inositol alpha-mannosyltransferase
MNIALVCPYAWDRVGGVQTHVRALAETLRSRGHDATVVAPRSARSNGSHFTNDVVLVGRAVGIPANGSVAPVAFGPLAATGIRRALGTIAPDVVHLHEPLIPSLSLLALWNFDGPTVGTWHAAAESSAGYRAARPVLARVAERIDVRTAVSDAARALAGRYFPGDYKLTPNGLDTARFENAEPVDLGPGAKILFGVNRLERRKGLEVLIQAMTRLRDLDATLIVAGAGPQERHCRALARQLGVPAQFLGRVEEIQKPRIYRSVDIVCAPALGGESFGIVLVEAMASGAPLVCSDIQGFRAAAGGAAEFVPPGDPGLLADALRAVIADPDRAQSMRTAGRRMASMFDWKRLVAGVEDLYGRAVEAHH